MPRYSMSQQPNGQNGLLVENMLRKQEEYREGIRENHSNAKNMAVRLRQGGEIENLVGDLGEYRDRLKTLTENNIQQERQLNAFLQALQQVANQENIEDYQAQVDALMARSMKQMERTAANLQQEELYMDICTKLGEATAASRGGGDEELEVVETQAAPSTQTLKCPLSLTFLEDPVRHVTCGHVYSRLAILQHIRSDKRCPVPGCATQNIRQNELQPDAEIARQVKRAKRQQEIQEKAISQQAFDADAEEEFI